MIKQINQAQAVAGGITPGDTPGFPVKISVAGSYELTSNLEVPAATAHAIDITASHVTLNLNGFLIFKKAPNPSSLAISAAADVGFLAVSNGHIQGMGGISLEGLGNRVEGIQLEGAPAPGTAGIVLGDLGVVRRNQVINTGTAVTVGKNGLVQENLISNCEHAVSAGDNAIVERNSFVGGGTQASIKVGAGSIVGRNIAGGNDGGIDAGQQCLVTENTVRNTGQFGVFAGDGSVVTANRVSQARGGAGIQTRVGCTVKDNAVSNCSQGIAAGNASTVVANAVANNTGLGLALGSTAGYGGNVLAGNNSGGAQVTGGIQIDKNVCDSALC